MTPIQISGDKQLFLDDLLVDSWQGMALCMNPPVKRGPAVVADRPWEGTRVGASVSVLEDEGVYKLYYDTIDSQQQYHFAYAVSTDGADWEKPSLGLVEYQGSRDNNLLPVDACGTVFVDPLAPPEQHYKYITEHDHRGIYAYWSADGLHWERTAEAVLPLSPDAQNQAFWDVRLGRYVMYMRGWAENRRTVIRDETDNLLAPWPYQPREQRAGLWGDRLDPPTTELPIVLACDEQDPTDVDFYDPSVVQYLPDAYLSFPSAYRRWPEPPVGKRSTDGLLDIQMATSRDGIAWQRRERRAYVPLGLEGEPDSQQIYMAVGMIRHGDYLYQYYTGYDWSHGDESTERHPFTGALVRLQQRVDGFVSADAEYTGGTLTTKPLVFAGRRLELNLDASALGIARVALLDEAGQVLPGYGLEDCDLLEGNHVAQTVTWRGQPGVAPLAGRPVRLRFEMRATKLYAFQFVS